MFRLSVGSSQLALLIFSVSAHLLAQTPPPLKLKTYNNQRYAVIFQYPATWNSSLNMRFYAPPQIVLSGYPVLAAVGFGDSLPNQQRTEYPNTNLAGVQFSYAVLPTATEQQCQDAAKNGGNIDKSTSERINGVNYLHVSTDSAGMCHQVAEEIYAASHAGRCYLFDALIETICADTIEGARNITPAEINTVKLQLQHIMQSVKLDAKK